MPNTLMCCADGNSDVAGTWALCSSTAELDSETGTTAVAAAGSGSSSTFVPAAATYDALAVKLSHWTALPTSGTVSFVLRNNTTGTDVATVTVAYSDLTYIGTTASSVNGWACFKFGSTVTANGTDSYLVKVTNNTNQSLNLWRNATASNWCRQLRSTTTQAPAAGDKLLVNREWTGSGASTTRTVTETRTLSTTGATLTGTGANNAGVGTVAWTNPTNAQADDGTYATFASSANNAVSNYLRATNFGFAVPAGAQVTGVRVDVKWKANSANVFRNTSVRLVKAGTGGGNSLAYSATLPTSDTVWTYGSGPNDTWGNTLSVSDVNNSGFGVEISLTHLLTASDTASVDYVKLTVYYVQVPYGAVVVSDGGTYQFGVSAATDYAAAITGLAAGATSGSRGLEVCVGGTFTMGTSGGRVPSDSTATLYFAVGSAVAFGAEVRGSATQTGNGGAFRAYGATKTPWTRLASAAAANATALTVGYLTGDTTGWNVGDEVAVGGSNRSSSETEYRTLSAIGSSTTITLLQPLTTAKEGGANSAGDPVAVPVANLTRNVRVCGVSSTLTTYCAVGAGGTFDADNAQFQYVGSATGTKRGIETANSTTAPSLTLQGSVLRDLAISSASQVVVSSPTASVTIDSTVFYGATTASNCLNISNPTSGAHTITNNCVIGKNRSVNGISLGDVGSTVTGNLVTDCATAFNLIEAATVGTFSANHGVYSATGLSVVMFTGGTISSCVFARCSTAGASSLSASNGFDVRPAVTLSSCKVFGNATNVNITNAYPLRVSSCSLYSEASYASTTGMVVNGSGAWLDVDNTTFASHTTSDLLAQGVGVRVRLTNCLLGSTTELSSQTLMGNGSLVISVNHDQVAGAMKVFKCLGTLTSDTTLYRTASPSLRLTPNNASFKLTTVNESSGFKAAVASGGTVTVSAYVRCSATGSGDAATYNGNRPRLMLRRNPVMGVTDDTVLATATSAANGAWELLTATTPSASAAGVFEFYIDCDGTAGWVNVDDVSFS